MLSLLRNNAARRLLNLMDGVLIYRMVKYIVNANVLKAVPVKYLRRAKFHRDDELKDEPKFVTSSFLRASTIRCLSRYNQALDNCLFELFRNQTIKIFQFDKVNGVAVLNSDSHFKKLTLNS